MIIRRDLEQNSTTWLAARAGIVTASEVHRLVSAKTWKPRESEGVTTYLAEKLSERVIGGPLQSLGSWAMEQGNLLEEEAVPWLANYLMRRGEEFEIERVGIITTDDGAVACSPDGLLTACGVEIKSLQWVNHMKILMAQAVPDEYLVQIHTGMYVTGFDEWIFCAFHRTLPKFVKRVKRDPVIQAVIGNAIRAFNTRLDTEWKRCGLTKRERSGNTPTGATPYGSGSSAPTGSPAGGGDGPDLWKNSQ